jgi:hypothetical protein
MPKPKMKTLGKLQELVVTDEQFDKALQYGRRPQDGGYQRTFGDVVDKAERQPGRCVFKVYPAIVEKLRDFARRPDEGGYQGWSRDVLKANNIDW